MIIIMSLFSFNLLLPNERWCCTHLKMPLDSFSWKGKGLKRENKCLRRQTAKYTVHPQAPQCCHLKQLIVPNSNGTRSQGARLKKAKMPKWQVAFSLADNLQSMVPVGFALRWVPLMPPKEGQHGCQASLRSCIQQTHCMGQSLDVQAGLVQSSECKIKWENFIACICICVECWKMSKWLHL